MLSAGGSLGDAELVAHPLEHRPRGEDAAVERVLDLAVDAPGDRGQQAAGRLGDLLADVGEDEDAGAVGRLDAARLDAGGAGERRLLVDDLAAERQLDRPALVRAACRARRPCRESRAARPSGTPKISQRRSSKPGPVDPLQLRPRGGRGVGGEARAEPVAEERVDRAHPQPAVVAGLLDVVVVAQQPGELGGGEVGVEGQPAELLDLVLLVGQLVEDLLGALVLPDDDRAERLAGLRVPGEHRLALVVEAAGDDLAVGSSSSSATASVTAAITSSPSCSTQPSSGWRLTLSRRASATGCSRWSKSAALTPVVPSSMPSNIPSLMRPPYLTETVTGPRSGSTAPPSPPGCARSAREPVAQPARSRARARPGGPGSGRGG